MRALIACLLSLTCVLDAAKLEPWFGRDKEFEARAALGYASYNTIQSDLGEFQRESDDYTLDLALAISPVSRWNVEAELGLIRSSAEDFNLNHLKGTVQYLILNDVIGDAVSLTVGGTLIYVSGGSEHDPSTPYHGNWEVELHTSVGREWSNDYSWCFRSWLVGVLGYAFDECPWIRLEGACEWNLDDTHRIRVFARHRHGFGGDPFPRYTPFAGYGCVEYYGTDIGLRYGYVTECAGTYSFEIWRRLLADNYPEDVTAVEFAVTYPFGI